jgi:hypothetical protein
VDQEPEDFIQRLSDRFIKKNLIIRINDDIIQLIRKHHGLAGY